MKYKNNLTNNEIVHKIGEKVEYIQFKRLLEYKDIISHAYTLRNENISFGPNLSLEEYNLNYKNLCKELNINHNNVVRPHQKHTANVYVMSQKQSNLLEYNPIYLDKTDGLVTNKKDIILSTTNADCILFLLFDPVNKAIANIHSGWRGTLEKIIINTVNQMQLSYNSNPKDLICCICPSIRKCHFEVDEDVKKMFYDKFNHLPNINSIIERKGRKYHIDTVLLNKTLLLNIGLKEENIIDSNICSVCHQDRINSYRVHKEKFKLSTAIISLI